MTYSEYIKNKENNLKSGKEKSEEQVLEEFIRADDDGRNAFLEANASRPNQKAHDKKVIEHARWKMVSAEE